MKKRNTCRFVGLGLLLVTAFGLTSCLKDSLSGCPTLSVRVVFASAEDISGGSGSDLEDLQPTDVENVKLYVFDQSGTLLDIRQTMVGAIEPLNYPNVESFHFVALANVVQNCVHSELSQGDHVSTGNVTVNESAVSFLDMALHDYPDEVFWGNMDALNNEMSTDVIDVPIKRMVAGVHVRVFGLREHMEQSKGVSGDDYVDEDFAVVLGCGYNTLNYLGEVSCGLTRAVSYDVKHITSGKTQTLENSTEVFNLPAQPDVTGEGPNYFPILSTYDGSAVSVGLYHGDTMITSEEITTDRSGEPLHIYNNKMNIIDITFRTDGNVTVKVTQVGWNQDLDIEVDF